MKIAVDAKGGDFSPQITASGAIRHGWKAVAGGAQDKISEEIARTGLSPAGRGHQ